MYPLIKRFLDIFISLIALIIFSPVFILIILILLLTGEHEVFYRQERVGYKNSIFGIWKFATMLKDSPNMGSKDLTMRNDPRVTAFGKFLRKSKINELPQLFNVFKGDMSLVGNRPLPLYEAATLTTDVWAERFMAPAGITGLWQIKKRGQEDMSVEERIGLDIAYANRNNFMYDLWIMANTPTALIQKSSV